MATIEEESRVCGKCGGRSFWRDAEDGWVCTACRKPYAAPWPPPAPESPLSRPKFTWADRIRAVELSRHIGVLAAAREFGVGESTIYHWRGILDKGW